MDVLYLGQKGRCNMDRKKYCNACGTSKKFEEFAISRSHTSGLQPYCRECNKLMQKVYREQNKEKWDKINPYTGEPYEVEK